MITWFAFSVVTYGTAVPAGIFFPGILTGCALGHIVGTIFTMIGII